MCEVAIFKPLHKLYFASTQSKWVKNSSGLISSIQGTITRC